ncbi:hypothetical protein LJK88_45085 [Paenibacillus sp. P26]|nr:hypothetical protein LJK88_45085 [Paenibacillus sp. P26]
MGKPTGFIEYNRETPAEAAPLMRIAHWKEFSVPMPEDKLQQSRVRAVWIAAFRSATPAKSSAAWRRAARSIT